MLNRNRFEVIPSMTRALRSIRSADNVTADLPELHTGDRMSREEFHRVYERTPRHIRAELIGGIVYVASPLKLRHGTNHIPLASVLFAYEASTPGVQSGDNTTVLLGEDAEPQPDLFLRILPEYGGQSKTLRDDYLSGPPELIAEIASSSRAIDLHAKREDYARHGVLEYLVVCVREQELRWFDLGSNQEHSHPSDGILQMRAFPGLWIDVPALFGKDFARLMSTLQKGLATEEHANFVTQLALVRGGRKKRKH